MMPVSSPQLSLMIDPPEMGAWCPHCALPSAVSIPWMVYDRATLRLEFNGVHVQCVDCDRWWAEDV